MQYAILPTNRDIVHWGKGKEAKQHKYVDRKMGPNGKWIYYYTNKPSLAARTGIYAKQNVKNARAKYENTVKKSEPQAKKGIELISKSIKTSSRADKNKGKDLESYLRGRSEKEFSDGITLRNNAWGAQDKRLKAYNKAVSTYNDTPLGKLESLGSSIKDIYDSGTYWLKKKLKIW